MNDNSVAASACRRLGRSTFGVVLLLLCASVAVLAPSGRAAEPESASARLARAIASRDSLEGTRRAWIAFNDDQARRDAAAVDSLDPQARAQLPLAGLLIAVKDNLDVVGFATTAGSKKLAARTVPAVTDAVAVDRVRRAGAIIVGKTNLDTFARGVRTVSEVRGATTNAFDPRFGPGGSSGGSAVAVATGAADAALGSDTCGSLRYPATYNAIYGLRPTVGLVPRTGLVALAPTQDVVGPMARDVRTLGLVLAALSGTDGVDRATISRPTTDTTRAPGDRVRLGVVRTLGAFEKDVSGRTALDRLRSAGAELIEVTLPSGASLSNASAIQDEAPYAIASALDGRAYDWSAPVATRSSGHQVRLAQQRTNASTLVSLLDRSALDALVYPTTPFPPARAGKKQASANCWLASTSGLPALALPHGRSAIRDRSALPAVGVDLLGRPFSEQRLLEIAAAYERNLTDPVRSPVP